MKTTEVLRERRTLLPLCGIILALGALLLVPIVVGRQTRALRDDILTRQVPLSMAAETFRISVANEIAATRAFLVSADSAAAEWLTEAVHERGTSLESLRMRVVDVEGVIGVQFLAVAAAAARLPSLDALTPTSTPDTARLWDGWGEVTAAADFLIAAVEAERSGYATRITSTEQIGFALTAVLAFLALSSALVTYRMERQVREYARASDQARREQQVLLESSGEGVFGLDNAGRCTFLNPSGALLIGYPEAEVLGRDLRRLLLKTHRDTPSAPEFLRSRGFGGGPIYQTEEVKLSRGDGSEVEVECITSPIRDNSGVSGAVVTLRNISHRKSVERERLALLQREQSLRARAEDAERRAKFLAEASELFAASLDIDTTLNSLSALIVPGIADSCVIYLVDDGGAIHRLQPVHIDPERQRLLSQQLDRYPPRIETLIPPVRRALTDGVPSLVHSVSVDAMKAVPGDSSHSSVIGSVGLQSLIVVPLKARGRILGAISHGASESRRQYGPEDLALAEDLATRAGMALDNARLYQQSQAAVRARNEVLGIVSHDLRNPLNAVRFGAQALLRHWPPRDNGEVEKNQLSAITRAADRMHRLIRDLLDVAQIDTGKLAVEPAPVPAAILLREAVDLSAPAAADKGVRLALEVPAECPILNVDSERILQVLSNLISNSIKFSPSDTEITVSAARNEGEVVFQVRDRGRGIDAGAIPHIFNRFWRARNGSREGAGLGLAIARGIVESHGGRIWVDSEVGQGSTFHFALPAADTINETPTLASSIDTRAWPRG